MSYHLNMYFSTEDRDNDQGQDLSQPDKQRNCAKDEKGGWWYNNCSKANLNGLYLYSRDTSNLPGKEKYQGMTWHDWRGSTYSLAFARMMVRPYGAEV